MNPLDLLLQRRSHPSRQLLDPGPDADQLRALVEAALRVPDHGKLGPWRFVIIDIAFLIKILNCNFKPILECGFAIFG